MCPEWTLRNWLGGRDSNPDTVVQSHVSYRWTTSHQGFPRRAETTIIYNSIMGTARFRSRLILGAAALLLLSSRNGSAQSSAFVTGAGFAEVKRFDSSNGLNYYGYNGQTFSLDGTAAGGGLRIGTFLTPRWSLELAGDVGGRTKSDLPDLSRVLAAQALPVRFPQMKASTQFVTVSTTIGFHPAAGGRVRVGYFAGVSFVRATYKSDYPSYGYPVPLFSTGDVANGAPVPVALVYPPPNFNLVTSTQKDNATGVILGFEAAVNLTKHLAAVPEFRFLTFSTPQAGPGAFLIRPGVAIRWGF
jgi:hypothetical protein